MKLSTLLNGSFDRNVDVHHVTMNSKEVTNGSLFVAVSGFSSDGVDYIGEAIDRGAVAIIAEVEKKEKVLTLLNGVEKDRIPVIHWAENARIALSGVASIFYPGQPNNIAAVTGTSGKSSTVWFVRQILEGLGHSAASLGTIGLHAGALFEKSALTTADPVSLHKTLAKLKEQGVDHLAIEASSIGIEQNRIDGMNVKVAAFTNLSHEHLDYHADMEAYFKAKQRLFTHCLDENGISVLNSDAPEYSRLLGICEARSIDTISYGKKETNKNTIRLINRKFVKNGQDIDVSFMGQNMRFFVPLIGAFQVYNILCAIGIVYGLLDGRIDLEKVTQMLSTIKAVPGRLERIDGHPEDAAVYVDYAHKPDALRTVLDAVRPHTEGKLHVVFGCGGDRDRSKRSLMGQIAYDLADEIIITDDNPRTEAPDAIRAEIADGFPTFKNIGDRREAINLAISSLQTGDALIIAGKGHESGQTIQAQTFPFDDRDEARQAIQTLIDNDKESNT